MINYFELVKAYEKATKGHESSIDYIDFAMDEFHGLYKLWNDINNRTFVPSSYSFIKRKPRPREVFGCLCPDRIVHNYLDIRIRPLVESKLTDSTYNNRVGYGTINAVKKVIELAREVSENYTKEAYFIKLDYTGFFPNADMNIVYSKMSKLIDECYIGDDKEDVKYMLKVSLLTHPSKDCEIRFTDAEYKLIDPDKSIFNKPEGIGAAIGYLINQLSLNYYVNDIDQFLKSKGIKFVRFVDDLLIVTNDKEYVLSLIPEIRKLSAEIGCTISFTKFYCQSVYKGVEFLGYHIKVNRVHLNNRIYYNWKKKIEWFDKHINIDNIFKFQATMNSYLGMTKITNDKNKVDVIISKINPLWYTWLDFNPIRRCFQIKPWYKLSEQLDKIYRYKIKHKI